MFEQPSSRDYYQILEVGYDATTDEIQKAFEQARRIYAHDALVAGTVLTESERRAMLGKISEAYQTLVAEESRRHYDRTLDRDVLLKPAGASRSPVLAEPDNLPTRGEGEVGSSFSTVAASEWKTPETSSTTSLLEVVEPREQDDSSANRGSFRLVKGAGADEAVETGEATEPTENTENIDPNSLPANADSLSTTNAGEHSIEPKEPVDAVEVHETESDEANQPDAGALVDEPVPRLEPSEEATGEFIRRVRQAKGVDFKVISDVTKIGTTMLRYIEEERLDRLPAPVYLKNFTVQFVECLGLEASVATSYLARIKRLRSE